jgi:CheY-like chemotaxis protein
VNNTLHTAPQKPDHPWSAMGPGARFQGFPNLMRFTASDILLVSSAYDSYILMEDGRLYESIREEYEGLRISHSAEITHVASGREALELAASRKCDLIIATLHIEDMPATKFARLVRQSHPDTPLVLLAYDNREGSEFMRKEEAALFDRVFLWQGNSAILTGIIKCVEDWRNVDHDTVAAGVQVILLVEDDIRSYSAFLPTIYAEIEKQSHRLIAEGINLFDRVLRMRARPRILLCTTYDEAWRDYKRFAENVLGIICDIDLSSSGEGSSRTGVEFARGVKADHPDIPILLQSRSPDHEPTAHRIGASFLLKDSPTLLHDLRQFMSQYFSFGEFIFRKPDGTEVARAADLKTLEDLLRVVPDESIVYHAERNHFSNWLKARTEFRLAHKLRPRKVSDFPSAEALRQDLVVSVENYRRARRLGQIEDFDPATFDPASSLARIGGGSLGGKARGLAFFNTLVSTFDLRHSFDRVEISIPPAVILGTDVFDQFLTSNDLRDFALLSTDDIEITRRFLQARHFPRRVRTHLASFLDLVRCPLAIRSSSLLEDSQYHPFAGVYATYMIPNVDPDKAIRLRQLIATIKRVYASTFYRRAKDYMSATSYRMEEEKMAVIVQKMVGSPHGNRFYPDFSGVGRSHNFYPLPPQKAENGIVSVALGLGRTIVDGGIALRFCPKYPNHIHEFSSAEQTVRNSQKDFYALDLEAGPTPLDATDDTHLAREGLERAESDGVLRFVGSTYSHDNETVYDGLSRSGMRLVTFAPVLKHRVFPLPQITEALLDLGSWGMGTPVEIEFAATLSVPPDRPSDFGLLQIRPLVLQSGGEGIAAEDVDPASILCRSTRVLGNGVLRDLQDLLVVDIHRFDRSKTVEIAAEISRFNSTLVAQGRSYLLIGVGRWGSLDPWLGIPVRWDQISGARAIVEAGFKDFDVEPSQGSHFFQNITSFMIGYFTVTEDRAEGFLDWDWILGQSPAEAKTFTRWLHLERPLLVVMDGRNNSGVILKTSDNRPGAANNPAGRTTDLTGEFPPLQRDRGPSHRGSR